MAAPSFILALDQGTTSSRAILFDGTGEVRGVAQREYAQHFPQPGWVEHDPDEIWSTQAGVAAEVIARADLGAGDIAGIGLTNQRETVVIWERSTGRPIHRAIVWQDRRTASICSMLREAGHAESVRALTGLMIDPYFSATKISWLLDHIPGARRRAERGDLCFGTVDSWLVWRLTHGSRHVTDVTNASRTLLFNIHAGQWDDELLGLFRVPRAMLPEVRASSEVYAETPGGDFLAKGIPIAGIAGDQHAALFGQQCVRPGMVKNTYGTGCFTMMHTGTQPVASKNRLLTTAAWKIGDTTEYALEGSVFIAGAVVQWLRDGLGIIRSSSDVEALAASVPDTGGVYLVPAFAGLGAPHWDSQARGLMIGLTRGTTSAHLARAALESMAFQTVDVIDALQRDSGTDTSEMRVDGGATANNLLMQIQADLLGIPIVRPRVTETTALGAAYLAGLAVGFWPEREAIAQQWQADRVFEPQISRDAAGSRLHGWRRAVERAKGWAE